MRTTVHAARPTSAAVGLTALALLATGCGIGTTPVRPVTALPVTAPSPSPSAVAPTSVAPTAEPARQAPVRPAPVPASSASTAPPAAGPSSAYDVRAVQRRLAELAYYGGAIDGQAGPATRSAVMAFQKVQGLGADGTVGPRTLAALAAPRVPSLRDSSPADRVEVDLTRQVLYVVEDGRIERILPVSSGNGATYRQNGVTAHALTPVGRYTVERRIVGVREADLGTLYDPQYFYRGWAIHGSDSVPAVPASHGCVRVTRADAVYLLGAIDVGTSIHLYGGTHVFRPGGNAPGTDDPTGSRA